MIKVGEHVRLTDDLERRLLLQEIENQYRMQPLISLKKLFAKLSNRTQSNDQASDLPANAKTAH